MVCNSHRRCFAEYFFVQISGVAMNYIELAEQANGEPAWPGGVAWTWDELERFAKLVAAQEREGCAKADVFEGDIRALKHRIHELEGELLGYKKIVADQDSIMTAQAMRIVDLKTHIENLEGEDR
jgi:hypothetical protein